MDRKILLTFSQRDVGGRISLVSNATFSDWLVIRVGGQKQLLCYRGSKQGYLEENPTLQNRK